MESELRITDEPVGFATDELIECPRCRKANGPDRAACLYCGEALPVTARNAAARAEPLRRMENWEPAFNLVAVRITAEVDVSSAAKLMGIDADDLKSMLDEGSPMPLARVENKTIADETGARLREFGLTVAAIDDREMNIERPPTRLRNLDIERDKFILTNFNSGENISFDSRDISLIVTGRITETRRDEVTKRKKGKSEVLDETETGSDLRLIDLYSSQHTNGYRIQTNGFDFSVLGEEMGMFADENIGKLAGLLKTKCPNAVFADEYDDVRSLLDVVWEPETRKDVHGLQLRGYGKREFGATYTSSNLTQFTKYSRMRRLLI